MAFSGRTLAWAAVVATTTGLAVPATAAPSTAGDDVAADNRVLGAAAAVLGRFRVEASMNTLYDSNMIRLGNGFPLGNYPQKSDFRFSPIVTLSTAVPVGRQQLFVSGTIGRDMYVHNTQLNRNRYAAAGGLNWRLGTRCSGLVDTNFESRQQLLSELSVVQPNKQDTFTYGASANCQTATGIGFGGSVRRVQVRNDSPDRVAFDANSWVFSPQLTYGSPNLGQFSLTGSWNKADYPEREILTTAGVFDNDGVEIISGRFGYERSLGSRLQVKAGISYIEVDPQPRDIVVLVPTPLPPPVFDVQTREKSSNLGFDAAVSYKSGSRLSGTVSASRRATASVNVGAQYQLVQAIGLDVDYRMNRAISLGTGITYDQRDYRNSFISQQEPLLRVQDKITRVYGSINYAPVELYSVGFELSYQDRKSDPVEYSYDAFAAMLRLRVNFGR
nr:outer membrane beta-barrel protein [Polymorphobacter sp.]